MRFIYSYLSIYIYLRSREQLFFLVYSKFLSLSSSLSLVLHPASILPSSLWSVNSFFLLFLFLFAPPLED